MRTTRWPLLLLLIAPPVAHAQAVPTSTQTDLSAERVLARREAGCCHSLLLDRVIDRDEHDRLLEEGGCCERLTSEYDKEGGDGPVPGRGRRAGGDTGGAVLSVQRILQVITMLGAVILLAYVLLGRVLPRFLKIEPPLAPRKLMTVIDRLPIDQRRSIMVLKVGAHYYLVGASEGGINLLSRLDADEIAQLLAERGGEAPGLGKLATSWLSRTEKRT